jgi:hypothetical protein
MFSLLIIYSFIYTCIHNHGALPKCSQHSEAICKDNSVFIHFIKFERHMCDVNSRILFLMRLMQLARTCLECLLHKCIETFEFDP